MYRINAEVVYVCERVYENPRSVARLERMLGAIKPKIIKKVDDEQLNALIEREDWHQSTHNGRTGSFLDEKSQRILIFNNYIWNSKEREEILKKHPKLGILGWNPFSYRIQFPNEFCVCQAAWEMHSLNGCLHTCAYCHINEFIHVTLNLEELVEHLEIKMEECPGQQLYKYDNQSDQITFEPEYGASELLVNFFANLKLEPRKYLLLYTKSDNVEHLLNLNHNGRTIINWSISPATQSRYIEKNTPSIEKRLIAMKKCQEAGYIVRVRFSPIIPVKDWKAEYKKMIQDLFKFAKPDVITLDILGFMSPRGMLNSLELELFDDDAREQIRKQLNIKKRWQKHVFPHEYRTSIYRYIYKEIRAINKNVPISICNETFEMWEELEDEWFPKMEVEDYVCCCGPTSVPGNPRFPSA
ncbi:MAG: spore photoproduct lyase family protein [Candidatus Hodarchaeota archaeon]